MGNGKVHLPTVTENRGNEKLANGFSVLINPPAIEFGEVTLVLSPTEGLSLESQSYAGVRKQKVADKNRKLRGFILAAHF